MRIAIFNWRDLGAPKSGGAEVATDQLARGLTRRGHAVTWFTSTHRGVSPVERRGGYTVLRAGSELTCRIFGFLWLLRNRKNVDVVIDEVNTLPFLSRLVARRRHMVWMHQLAREVWLMEAPPVVGRIGYAVEPLLMSIYRDAPIATISDSSAQTFRDFGLRGPITVAEISLRPAAERFGSPEPGLIGYVGRVAPSKRIDHLIRAIALLRRDGIKARLLVVGSGPEREFVRLKSTAQEFRVLDAVQFTGRISHDERDRAMAQLDVLAMTSVREGWGLVVSEAARYGVPSVVYPVPGLVDAVHNGITGIVVPAQTPQALANGCRTLIRDRVLRDRLGAAAAENLLAYDEERFVGSIEKLLQSLVTA